MYLFNITIWANELPQFFADQTHSAQQLDEKLYEDTLQVEALAKHKRYVSEDQPIEEYSILDNNFYQDEGFRFYNNTQYSLDDVRNKYAKIHKEQVTLDDLSISLGYGMEFNLSRHQSIGYEYISAFPHDRGQSIRLFWKKTF